LSLSSAITFITSTSTSSLEHLSIAYMIKESIFDLHKLLVKVMLCLFGKRKNLLIISFEKLMNEGYAYMQRTKD
ncbi:MAG: hypothetical protein QXG05_04530, partial [Nitrososphaerota archaeon]